eukprot:SAG11_NODE_2347_length_3487_cov_1.303129_5_plen_170_part_00
MVTGNLWKDTNPTTCDSELQSFVPRHGGRKVFGDCGRCRAAARSAEGWTEIVCRNRTILAARICAWHAYLLSKTNQHDSELRPAPAAVSSLQRALFCTQCHTQMVPQERVSRRLLTEICISLWPSIVRTKRTAAIPTTLRDSMPCPSCGIRASSASRVRSAPPLHAQPP